MSIKNCVEDFITGKSALFYCEKHFLSDWEEQGEAGVKGKDSEDLGIQNLTNSWTDMSKNIDFPHFNNL